MAQRVSSEKHIGLFNAITRYISFIALGISALSLFQSCEANKQSKEVFEYGVESKRARLEIPITGQPTKIKITRTDTGFEATSDIYIQNVGQSPAVLIAYETSGNFDIKDNPVTFKEKSPILRVPLNLIPGTQIIISETCVAVIPSLSEREELIKKIEDGIANITANISITYKDLCSSNRESLSAKLNFNIKTFCVLNLKEYKIEEHSH